MNIPKSIGLVLFVGLFAYLYRSEFYTNSAGYITLMVFVAGIWSLGWNWIRGDYDS